ncbi:GHKL domain-containing protein [Paenibacillus puldeungensis]|uniref:GHKL domain-containing protein n=1 Tax=Paenibacillus puldeungensis TaxID=696536 RepID=A0ABW3S092_9BACL
MMEWVQIISNLLTNNIRIFLCLFLVAELLKLPRIQRNAAGLSLGVAAVITVLTLLPLSQFYLTGIEIVALMAIAHYLFHEETRMCLFLIFFYEISVALWDFLISAGLGMIFQSERFVDSTTSEYMIAIWIVRLFMIGIATYIVKKRNTVVHPSFRLAAIIALLGMFGVIALSEQNVISLNDDQLTSWTILSLMTVLAVLLFNLNRKYEMEKEIAQLKEEQAALLERNYEALRDVYSTHAKLFHDLHNHVEIMYRYLTQGKAAEATQYLEALRTPIREITQTVWTGEEAVDYLINSKIALAAQSHIEVKANIEFPRHTNIRSTDLVAILGNLLDNALEAAENANGDLRFISLTIRRINEMLVIKVENGYRTAPVTKDGKLQTSKSDKELHGWGLKSACAAVERYDGTVEISYEKNIFRVVTTLSYNTI